jgi:hypothetical protein
MGLGFTGRGRNGGEGLDTHALQQLRGYWEALRRPGRLPARSEIDPRGIAGALENAFLLDRIAPGVAKIRLCGMALQDVMGMEPAGMPLSVLLDPVGRDRLAPALEQVFAGPSALELWLEAERGIGKPALAGRMLILPLSDAAGEVRMALGGLVTDGAIGRQPRRFAIATLMSEALSNSQPQPGPLLVPAPPRVQELAEAPAHFAPRAAPGRPHLRLVSSRD